MYDIKLLEKIPQEPGVYLMKNNLDEILYVGNKGGMEERLVPAAGYTFKAIRISGFQRCAFLSVTVLYYMKMITSANSCR